MNYIASIMVIMLSSFIGAFKSSQLKKNELQLNKILIMAEKIKSYLKSEQMQTEEIILRLSQNKTFDELEFLKICHNNFSYKQSFDKLWQDSILECKDKLFLSEEDRATLLMLGEILGSSDVFGQLRGIEMFEGLMEQSLEKISLMVQTKGKLYRSLGVLCGIGFAIMII